MIPIIFVLFTLLDYQQPLKVDEATKTFVVSEMIEEALSGCAENGQGGVFGNDPLTVDGMKPQEIPMNPNVDSTWFSGSDGVSGTDNNTTMQTMVMRVVPVDPPNPDPNPGDPPSTPSASTPEPASVAILGITGLVLLFLLFGRRSQKSYRRT